MQATSYKCFFCEGELGLKAGYFPLSYLAGLVGMVCFCANTTERVLRKPFRCLNKFVAFGIIKKFSRLHKPAQFGE